MKKSIFAAAISLVLSPTVLAASYQVDIQNLTRGVYFTPLLVSAHPSTHSLFTTGMPASTHLQAMAEGGNISGLSAELAGVSANSIENPAGGLLAPGESTTADLGSPDQANTQLSIVAMIVPTNDAFVGLNSLTMPTAPGTYVYMLNAYDAGTEANDEIRGAGMPGVAGMPVPPPLEDKVGHNGTGIPNVTAEGFVHIHRGMLGDFNLDGGVSDINAADQRWLNPVARVTITVTGE